MIDSLSIVLPAYNEKDNLAAAVSEAVRVGQLMAGQVEVIVVDDASLDGTGALADRLEQETPELLVVHHVINRGLGGALQTGFAAATKQWVLYTDSDLPVRMDDALEALPLTETADAIVGWRRSRAESWRREINSRIYNWMVRTFFGLRVRDINFAFKLFRRSFLSRMSLRAEGSFIDAELLLELRRTGARMVEMGLDYYPRVAGVSTIGGLKVVPRMMWEMTKYRVRRPGRRATARAARSAE
jgi:glycosyltransferase involved in cell wall biosynthesis